jgi:hypothetical protein
MSTKIKVTTTIVGYSGRIAGVNIVDGEAVIELPRQGAALEFFRRRPRAYTLAEVTGGEPAPDEVDDDKVDLDKLTREELDNLAVERGIDLSSAKKKADVIELLTQPESPAAKPEGDAGIEPAVGELPGGDEASQPPAE